VFPSKPKILFLVPYPLGRAPSQRYRVESFLPLLDQVGIIYHVQPFLDDRYWRSFYTTGKFIQKAFGIIIGFARRFRIVLSGAYPYSYVFIHREAAPLGPPLLEWILVKIWRKKIIYDFDDAIWIEKTSTSNRWIGWAKSSWKVKYICSWSYRVVCGNEFLSNYALRFNSKVLIIPTVVDTDSSYPQIKEHKNKLPVVGWSGSHSTLHYLNLIIPTLQRLQADFEFEFLVIADKDPQLPLSKYRFLAWDRHSEQSDLLQMDIGVMPLDSNVWSEGKCGFKLIQYFASGLPAIASSVGVNRVLIQHSKNGFLCDTPEDWYNSLRALLANVALREEMGILGRQKVLSQYSVKSQKSAFLSLFN